MAVNYDSAGTFGTDGNWTNAANWPDGGFPLDTESAIIYNATSNAIDTNLDQNLVTLVDFRVSETTTVSIGGAGNVLDINVSGTFYYNGRGAECHHQGVVGTLVVDTTAQGDNSLVLAASAAHTYTRVIVSMGRPTIGANCTVTTLDMPSTLAAGRIHVSTVSGSTTTTVNQMGGELTTNSTCTTHNQSGGICNQDTGTKTTVNLNGGTFFYRGGTCTTINLGKNGILDLRKQTAKLGTGTINYKGGRMLWSEEYTNGITVNILAPGLGIPVGKSFTV